jgi:hypothetical protein
MSRVEAIVEDLVTGGFTASQIRDFLCDGEAMISIGIFDEDKEAVEAAFDQMTSIGRDGEKKQFLA